MQFKPTIWDTANGGNPIKPLGKGDTLSFLTPDPVVKTATFSALANYSYSLNPSGGGFNIALPTIADNGAMLMFADTNGSAATQHIVLKQGTTTIAIINSAYGVAYLSFNTALAKWSVITLSVPYPAMSNYESVYVNPTYGDDITGTGLINNPFKTVQSAIDSFTAGSPHVIYVLGSTTEDISFRSNDQSMRIVLDAKSEHSGTITFVDGNTSIYFDCPNGDATISGVINDDSSGNIYFNGYVQGIYNKTGGGASYTPIGYVEFGCNSNIDGLTVNLTGNSTMRTLGTGNMGVLAQTNGVFTAQHGGTVLCPVISGGANPLLGQPITLLQGQLQLLTNGDTDCYKNTASYSVTYLAGISTIQLDATTFGRINFTGAGANSYCHVWSNTQLATSGDIFPSSGVLLPNTANYISGNYTPINYTPTESSVKGHLAGIDTALAGIPINSAANITSSNSDTVYTASKTYRITNTSATAITFTCTGTRTFLGTTFGNTATVLTIPASAVAIIQVLSATSLIIRNLSSFSGGGVATTFLSISGSTSLTTTNLPQTARLIVSNSGASRAIATLPSGYTFSSRNYPVQMGTSVITFYIDVGASVVLETFGSTVVWVTSYASGAKWGSVSVATSSTFLEICTAQKKQTPAAGEIGTIVNSSNYTLIISGFASIVGFEPWGECTATSITIPPYGIATIQGADLNASYNINLLSIASSTAKKVNGSVSTSSGGTLENLFVSAGSSVTIGNKIAIINTNQNSDVIINSSSSLSIPIPNATTYGMATNTNFTLARGQLAYVSVSNDTVGASEYYIQGLIVPTNASKMHTVIVNTGNTTLSSTIGLYSTLINNDLYLITNNTANTLTFTANSFINNNAFISFCSTTTLTLKGGQSAIVQPILLSGSAYDYVLWNHSGATPWVYGGNVVTGTQSFGSTNNADVPFISNNIERGRLTSLGRWYYNLTSYTTAQNAIQAVGYNPAADYGTIYKASAAATGRAVQFWSNTEASVGYIQTTASATTYATTSDERMKDDLGLYKEINVIDKLIIHNFKWKHTGAMDRGVFAQEAYEVCPYAVSVGTDEICEETGHFVRPWGVDYSQFVPDLIVYVQDMKKTIKEQQALIEQLSERLNKLEAK